MTYAYLASPYTHRDSDIRRLRLDQTRLCFVWLLKQKIWVYSPILHCRETSILHSLPTEWDFWWPLNRAMLEAADKLMIFTLEGWEDSEGIKKEVDFCHNNGKPITYVHPLAFELSNHDPRQPF